MTKQRILVVDDEASLCEILKFHLEVEGYAVDTAQSADEALLHDIGSCDLLLLDARLARTSGFRLVQALKERPDTAPVPVIFCTESEAAADPGSEQQLPADDCIVKPFSVREVVARVKSVLRRTTADGDDHTVGYQGLRIDLGSKSCTVGGQPVSLTKKEFEILSLLLRHRGLIFSREEILRRVWPDQVIVLDRTVDVNITRLRKKLGDYGKFIITRLGYGYGFDA